MYPRTTGHCHVHHIPKNIAEFEPEELQKGLDYLRGSNVDLVKGDLVVFDGVAGYRNDGIAIFDGSDIIELDTEPDDYGTLPKIFRVIENGVPINYWAQNPESNEQNGIAHNSIVWFDHKLVLQECLKNITYGPVDPCKFAIYTKFTYQNIQYRIIYLDGFDYDDREYYHWYSELNDFNLIENKNSLILHMQEKFRQILLDTTTLLNFEYIGETMKAEQHTLFLWNL